MTKLTGLMEPAARALLKDPRLWLYHVEAGSLTYQVVAASMGEATILALHQYEEESDTTAEPASLVVTRLCTTTNILWAKEVSHD